MPISLLPESATLLLGSTVTISSPHDLVKELLENAIDANATSVEVLISPDTIEKIQVRDNGHGIPVQDFEALGRKAYTSKLTTFEQLQGQGVETLGFRGEALAAANSICNLTVTTRTTSDPVGSRLQLKSGVGGAEDRRPISAAVGTTVLATKLFDRIPVRKQFLLKQRQKTVAGVKLMLQGYALARPYLKLSLKIQREARVAWSYTPHPPYTSKETIIQIFGRDAAVASSYVDSNTILSGADVQMIGTIPRRDCGVSTLKPVDCFISVDARPLTSSRGMGKKLIAILKSYLRKATDKTAETHSPTNIFFQLDIRCSPGSYDPNISPTKDEVIFKDEGMILKFFENLCRLVYQVDKESTTSAQKSFEAAATDISPHINSTQAKGLYTSTASNQARTLYSHDIGSEKSVGKLSGVAISFTGRAAHPPTIQNTQGSQSSPAQPHTCLSELPDLYSGSLGQSKPLERVVQPSNAQSRAAQHMEKPGLVLSKMRTRMRVDMSRKDSNSTEDEATMDLIGVQAPCLPRLPQPISTSRLRTSSTRGTIDSYFRPRRNEDFNIAVDETSVTHNSSPQKHSNTLSPLLPDQHPCTQYLRPLRDSILNQMHNGSERSNGMSDSEMEDLQVSDMPHENTVTPSPQGERSPLNGNIEWIGRGGIREGSINFRDIRRGQNHHASSIPTTEFPGLRTPPSSDPTQGQLVLHSPLASNPSEHTITPSQVIQQANIRGGSKLPHHNYSSQRGSVQAVKPSNHLQVPDMTELTRVGMFDMHFPGVHPKPVPSKRMNRYISNKSVPDHMERTQVPSRRPEHVVTETLGNQNVLLRSPSPQLQHYSHALQTMLLKTPPPRTTATPKTALRTAEDMLEVNEQRHHPLPQQLRSEDTQILPTEDREGSWPRSIRTDESTKIQVVYQKRQSGALLLQRLLDDEQLERIVIKAHLRMQHLKQLAHRMERTTCALASDIGDISSLLHDLAQVNAVESKLKEIVKEWKKEAGLEFEVQFTLRSQAKGKWKSAATP
ncbi:DNA mismatch repair protein MutL [Paramyrothecium foliicola]|nr:DNA mismatch repair protein MutL [Paramyrothecium foliicola]